MPTPDASARTATPRHPDHPLSRVLEGAIYEAAGLLANPATRPEIVGGSTYPDTALPGNGKGSLVINIGGDAPFVIFGLIVKPQLESGVLFNLTPSDRSAPMVLGAPMHSNAMFGAGRDPMFRLPRPLELGPRYLVTVDLTNLDGGPQHVWTYLVGYRRHVGRA